MTASGGTLLLDEIESLSTRAQVQLLRVLEDGLVQALGKDKPRKVDIRLLVSHFLRLASERNGIPVPEIPEKTLAEMMRHVWPGNVRELKNAVERMVITAHQGVAGPFSLDESFGAARLLSLPATSGRLRDELERTEKAVIEAALRDGYGEVNATAQALGISRRALYERMKKYGLLKEEFRS